MSMSVLIQPSWMLRQTAVWTEACLECGGLHRWRGLHLRRHLSPAAETVSCMPRILNDIRQTWGKVLLLYGHEKWKQKPSYYVFSLFVYPCVCVLYRCLFFSISTGNAPVTPISCCVSSPSSLHVATIMVAPFYNGAPVRAVYPSELCCMINVWMIPTVYQPALLLRAKRPVRQWDREWSESSRSDMCEPQVWFLTDSKSRYRVKYFSMHSSLHGRVV